MDYETSEQEYHLKQALHDFSRSSDAPEKMSFADKDDNNLIFMTIQDMQTEGIVDNFLKENLED